MLSRFRRGTSTVFVLVIMQDRMHRQRIAGESFFLVVSNCEQRTLCSGVTLPLTWRVGAAIPFQSGPISFLPYTH
jgi:hypothetical protein